MSPTAELPTAPMPETLSIIPFGPAEEAQHAATRDALVPWSGRADVSHATLLARNDVQAAITRLDDMMAGRVKGLTEEEFNAALHDRILSRRVS